MALRAYVPRVPQSYSIPGLPTSFKSRNFYPSGSHAAAEDSDSVDARDRLRWKSELVASFERLSGIEVAEALRASVEGRAEEEEDATGTVAPPVAAEELEPGVFSGTDCPVGNSSSKTGTTDETLPFLDKERLHFRRGDCCDRSLKWPARPSPAVEEPSAGPDDGIGLRFS